jgi:NDP-sugar pyrophosphorylase family protein
MIERIIGAAVRHGFRDVCVVVNEQIASQCGYLADEFRKAGVNFSLAVQSTPSSLHSFAVLAPLLRGEDFCLATTDSIFPEEEFSRYLSLARNSRTGDGLLAVTRYVDDENPLYAQIDGEMRILRFSDAPEQHEWVTGGLYSFSARALDLIEPALKSGTHRLRNFLRLLLANDFRLFGFPFSKIIDVDHASDVAAAEDFLSREQQTGVDL